MTGFGATTVALGTSPYVMYIKRRLERAAAANARVASTPMDSRTRANYIEIYRFITDEGLALRTRAATGEAETKRTAGAFKADYNAWLATVNDFVKAANDETPAPPPTVATPVRVSSSAADLPEPSTAADWTPWLVGGGVVVVAGLGFYGYRRGWFGRRRR